MTTVIIAPTDDEINEAISLHHDFDCPLKDAEVSISQPYSDDMDNADVIVFHPDRIESLVFELLQLQAKWTEASRPLYREPSTMGEW